MIETVGEFVVPAVFVAATTKEYDPVVVGVPVRVPFELRVIPVGTDPDATEYEAAPSAWKV